jgi:hypothetical protein
MVDFECNNPSKIDLLLNWGKFRRSCTTGPRTTNTIKVRGNLGGEISPLSSELSLLVKLSVGQHERRKEIWSFDFAR